MKIAVCDDDLQELARISSLLNTYVIEKKTNLIYKTFLNTTGLLSTMTSSDYDLLLLDILMPGMTGIRAAHEIRGVDTEVKIVFLSSSPEFKVESYAVNSYDYILKPVSKDKLFSILDAVIAEEQKLLEGMTVKTPSGMVRVLFSELTFVEIMRKKVYFHLENGNVLEILSPLADIEEQLLPRQEFVKVHRSYIVNLCHVREIGTKNLLTYSGKTLPISFLLYSKIREAYINHLFLEKGVE